MNYIRTHIFSSPFGDLILGDYENSLCLCDWLFRSKRKEVDLRLQKGLNASYIEEQTSLLLETEFQLYQYFQQQRDKFDLPIHLVGTDFQKKVWKKLQDVIYGQTISYLELSKRLGDPNAIRAVASANGANALSIIIPCHRIIGNKGELVGYAGGTWAKSKLLELENNHKQLALAF